MNPHGRIQKLLIIKFHTFSKSTISALPALTGDMDPTFDEDGHFVCAPCTKFFSTKWNYEVHLKSKGHLKKVGGSTADDAAQFVCAECGADFTRHSSLQRHLVHIHGEGKGSKFWCKICSKAFSTLSTLSRHQNSFHLLSELLCDQPLQTNSATLEVKDMNQVPVTQSESPLQDLSNDIHVVSPQLSRHCVTVCFPSISGDTHMFADDDMCSHLERHAFALVLLTCSLKIAIGQRGSLRVIACALFTEEVLSECADLLGFLPVWADIIPHVSRFSSFDSLESAMTVSDFRQSPLIVHSLFLIGHANFNQVRVNFGNAKKFLSLAQVVRLVHCCEPQYVHIMACKSRKLSSNAQRLCARQGICLSTVWCAYGDDDVTTVPFDFGSPLEVDHDWFKTPLDHDFDDAPHTHITTSVLSFLCSLSVAGCDDSVEDVVRSVQVPIHYLSGLALCSGHVDSPHASTGDILKLFQFSLKLAPVLARVGVSWAKLKWWLRKLEKTPRSDLKYA